MYTISKYYYNMETARNPNTPPDILRKILERGKNDWISINAVCNPNCPTDILRMVLERDNDDGVSQNAALNPNCPQDVLRKILEKGGNDFVSRNAAHNPNCPADLFIKWMMDTGKIGKEDPEKHIIENDNNEEKIDEDLEKLKQLIGNKKFNLKKYAQQNYYNAEIADNPNTHPDILRKILERGKGDDVSQYAAKNINCPSDALKMVLERGKDDWVSRQAVLNSNCPPDALRMILERDKNDDISRYAVLNHNCPEDALKMVLERGKDDWVSRGAAHNSNCPSDVMIKWMQDTGQIGKEDPKKHIIDKIEEEKIDEDLEKLKQLISNKKFNLKKYSQQDYYNIETAENPNTSPDILRKILERGRDDGISCFAVENPNCPPDLLRMVLERGKNDIVSQNTASNPNCPSDALRMVLERGKDDSISWYASQNPNCPPDAYIKWMRDTGQIEKEDPALHIIEKVKENNIDEDLEKLKQLISNKKFNLKKYSQQDYYNIETAKDPNTSPDILRKILERERDDGISRFAASNSNCPEDALRMVLERGKDDRVSYCAALNPNCPSDILRKILERGKNDSVSWYAAQNPNCPLYIYIKWMQDTIETARNSNTPPDLLRKILEKDKDDGVSQVAAQNLNCPPDALRMVLERGKDDYVSYWVSKNPNCPIDIMIKWMQDTGKIEKEDPSKHIIEYDNNINEIDEDLEKLKQLISKNNNLKKYSQQDYYNEETAIATTNPDILRKILEKGNNDIVSWRAAENPKCPKDARINWLIDIGKKEQAQREINNAYLEDFLKQYNKTEII